MRNLTNTGGDIFVNTMFGQGEAIEIVQQSYNTQALVNVSMKQGTTQATTLNDTDILIVAVDTNQHFQVLSKILKLKLKPKIVICEKPLTNNLKYSQKYI